MRLCSTPRHSRLWLVDGIIRQHHRSSYCSTHAMYRAAGFACSSEAGQRTWNDGTHRCPRSLAGPCRAAAGAEQRPQAGDQQASLPPRRRGAARARHGDGDVHRKYGRVIGHATVAIALAWQRPPPKQTPTGGRGQSTPAGARQPATRAQAAVPLSRSAGHRLLVQPPAPAVP